MAALFLKRPYIIILGLAFFALVNCTTLKKHRILHTVCLDLVDELTTKQKNELMHHFASLSKIKHVKSFTVSHFFDSGDPRLQRHCDVILTMSFINIAELKRYQEDPHHKKVIQSSLPYLNSPPVIFDSTIL